MEIVLSLNKKERLYDYIDMGINRFVIGGDYSSVCPYCFSLEEIKEIKDKYNQIFIYVSIDGLYDQKYMQDIESYIDSLDSIGVQGIIFQDFGVLQIVKEKGYTLDMMYSPETLNTNGQTLKVLNKQGVTSAFVSKVIPLEEQMLMKQDIDMPLMFQCHGVEYIAASKRNLLSNYRDASSLSFDIEKQDSLTIKAKDSDYEFHIFEDKWGTHIFSKSRLYALDLINHLSCFDYLYIETLMMNEEEAIEIASLYSDALKSYDNHTYDKDIKSYMNLLYQLNTPLDRGFLFDQTVYKLEDMRKIDNEKRESNH
ncbi:MAG: U32 family peptidase [Coprobacillus sp.]